MWWIVAEGVLRIVSARRRVLGVDMPSACPKAACDRLPLFATRSSNGDRVIAWMGIWGRPAGWRREVTKVCKCGLIFLAKLRYYFDIALTRCPRVRGEVFPGSTVWGSGEMGSDRILERFVWVGALAFSALCWAAICMVVARV